MSPAAGSPRRDAAPGTAAVLPPSQPPEQSLSRGALLAVALLALLVRIGFSLAMAQDEGPVGVLSRHLLGDERAYDAVAREVAAGSWHRTRAFYQAPAYPWLVGQLYKLWPPPPDAGDDAVVAQAPVHRTIFAVQHLFGILTALLTALLGARVLGRRAGLLAGLMAALSGPLVFHETMLLKSSLALLVLVICLHLWLDVLQGKGGPRRAALLGLLLGFSVLLRGNMLLLLAAVLESLLLPLGCPRRQPRRALLTALCALAALSPVTLHNLALGDPVLSTYQAGTNAAIGQPRSEDLADGLIYQPLRAGRGDARYEEADAIAFAEGATGHAMTGQQISAWWWRWVAESVASHPALAARRVALKLVHLFHGYEVPDVKSWAFIVSAAPWLSSWASNLWLLGPLALLGFLLLPWRRHPGLTVVRGGLAVVALTLALFYVMGRYRLSALPCLWVLAAGALVNWGQALSRRADPGPGSAAAQGAQDRGALLPWPGRVGRWLRPALGGRPGLGLAALGLLLASELGLALPSDVNGEHTSYANAASIACARASSAKDPCLARQQRDQAVAWARAAIAIAPAFPSPRNTLVRALSLRTGQLSPLQEEALDASWRLLLLMSGLASGEPLLDVLDGPLPAVRTRALQLLDAPTTPGSELFAGPLLAFACRAVAQQLSPSAEGRELSLALALIDRSLSAAPGETFAWVQRGALLRKLGRPEEAVASYRRALAAGEDSAELRNNLGNLLRSLGRFDEAVEQLRRALALRPGDPLVQRNLERARAGR